MSGDVNKEKAQEQIRVDVRREATARLSSLIGDVLTGRVSPAESKRIAKREWNRFEKGARDVSR